jgi:drug/metabolite transporter (DMT)-like permease
MLVGHRLKTWSLLVVVNLFWAAQYPAYRIVGESISIATLCFWSFVIASIVLLPSVILNRRRNGAPSRAIHLREVGAFGTLAVLGLIPPSIVTAWGIERSSASNASILSLTIPVLMLLMGIFMLKERPHRFVIVSITLALAGMILMSWDDVAAGNFSGRTLIGNFAIFLGGAGAAFYNAYCKKLLEHHTAVEVLLYGYIAATVLCGAISLAIDPLPFYEMGSWSTSVWVAVAVLGVIVWGVAMLIWMHLLHHLELGQISISVYMLPVFGVILSAETLNERLGLMQLAGGSIVLLSAYISSKPGTPSGVADDFALGSKLE